MSMLVRFPVSLDRLRANEASNNVVISIARPSALHSAFHLQCVFANQYTESSEPVLQLLAVNDSDFKMKVSLSERPDLVDAHVESATSGDLFVVGTPFSVADSEPSLAVGGSASRLQSLTLDGIAVSTTSDHGVDGDDDDEVNVNDVSQSPQKSGRSSVEPMVVSPSMSGYDLSLDELPVLQTLVASPGLRATVPPHSVVTIGTFGFLNPEEDKKFSVCFDCSVDIDS
eukprot:ANDGO_00424.mRNA.1 hypothetical protein